MICDKIKKIQKPNFIYKSFIIIIPKIYINILILERKMELI